MAIGDVYEMQVHQQIGSQPSMCVMHFLETVGSTDEIPADTLLQAYAAGDFIRTLALAMSEDWRVTALHVRRLYPTTGIPSISVFGAAEAIIGNRAPGLVPSQAAVLFVHYTELNTRRGIGRNFWAGLCAVDQHDGQVIDTVYDLLTAYAETIDDPIPAGGFGTGTWRQCVWSRLNQAAEEIVTSICKPNLATQRSRRAFAGFGN